mmetsp:Transcript_14253/g.20968  ORF Transcript_14253/g.20968 Transcript_14253/m.20968 type:complete len:387 (-) Transcript_14253:196-1356(-)|eukprot:CAMPEP_0113943762 /NCGR_PEP_ID=MMETSP1339-20121228/27403_1 /TAXON_ID=94617 /ORGANISM="Fibrocapsa japonica" /LENGTH=386 /DNA_ID=CAMNT_0000948713 /DNA_START=122 /DNA_END=1282 /DNA_ORIENTATION=+ /assembly_acc=CAM_ASM_000762
MEFVGKEAGQDTQKPHTAPETVTGEEGSAKRNIMRRHEKGPLKQGGQKGRWDPIDDGSGDGVQAIDKKDPNYDSGDEQYVLVSDNQRLASRYANTAPGPLLPLAEFKRRLTVTLEEYFLSEDVEEVARSISEYDSDAFHYEVVKRAINLSLDKRDHERELVSKMLSSLYPKVLDSGAVAKGFERLFEMIDDIQLDAPRARPMIAAFLARAVVDEILPPAFLSSRLIASMGGDVVEHAKLLLSLEHHGTRLEKIWGPGDGRPVEELKRSVDQLLEEYLLSRQLEEVAQCVRELDSPFFHHELVKRAVVVSLDKSSEDQAAISSLFVSLQKDEIISLQQIKKGFDRLHEVITDLILDTPNARELLKKFQEKAIEDKLLPADYIPTPKA